MGTLIEGRMLVGGSLTESVDGQWLDVISPVDEALIGHVPRGTARDVDLAVSHAAKAQLQWKRLEMNERGRLLREVADALRTRHDELTHLEVLDTGNTIGKMRGDVDKAIAQIEYFAGLGYELKGDTVPATSRNLHLTLREPYGVVGRIIPFNHPLMFAASRLAAPLMAGNTIVIKPAEQAPLSSSVLAEICAEILPAGVVNVVTGLGAEAGDALVRHPKVKRLGFTGSVATGMAIQRAAAEVAVKHISLELGGKNPCIIYPDADLERALDAAVAGMNFSWQGQSCGSTSRLFVHESQRDVALDGVARRVEGIKVGDPSEEASGMGPIITAAQYERVLSYIESGVSEGAELVCGGGRPAGERFEKGFWIEPTVFAGVRRDMRIFREEIFGPVLSVTTWSDRAELMDMVNSLELGLAASIWTQDLNEAVNTARDVEAGFVWVNGVSLHHQGLPFGGSKNSGIGREEGIEELFSYTEVKSISIYL